MVRRKIEIKKIESKPKRHTTFTKRRQGLFKKADDLCEKCGAEAAIIAFSLAGNAYAFGNPSVTDVVNRYYAEISSSSSTPLEPNVNLNVNVNEQQQDEDDDDDNDVVERERELEDHDDYDDVDDVEKDYEIELRELDRLKADVEEMKRKVKDRVNDIIKFEEKKS